MHICKPGCILIVKNVFVHLKFAGHPRTATAIQGGRGSVISWGCFAANGVGNLAFIKGTMDQYVFFLNISKGNLQESVTMLGLEGRYYFQQDNDPLNSTMATLPCLLKTPPQPPDMNSIENPYFKRHINFISYRFL